MHMTESLFLRKALATALAVMVFASVCAAATPEDLSAAGVPSIELPYAGETALRGPVDPDTYLVGPGDRFAVTIWGQEIVSFTQEVTPEGELVLPGLATIGAAGLSLASVKDDVRSEVSEFYRNVEVSVSLVRLRKILVNVLGDVDSPGAYVGTALDPASELIEKAGGLRGGASERNITITRRGGESERVDLTRYRNTGDLAANPSILDGDVIFVPHAREYVHVLGAVARPGQYERVDGETVASLLKLSGGFAYGAVTNVVEVREFINDSVTGSRLVDLDGGPGGASGLSDGDQVYVRFENEWRKVERVIVDGEVANPGVYGINEGVDRLSDVVRRAGGLTDEGSLRNAKVMRPDVRGSVDREFERLSELTPGSMTETEYAYYKTKLRGRSESVVVDFALALEGDESGDVLLLDGDRIVVPKKTGTIVVSGQVADPGHVAYVPGKRYSHYISEAGGYARDARRRRTTVIRGDSGEWTGARRAGEILPGDTVWVPEKPETDWWTTVKDIASFAASLATAYILIDQATQK